MPWKSRHPNPHLRKLKDRAKTSNTDSALAGQNELDDLDSPTDHSNEQDPLIEPSMAPHIHAPKIHHNPAADVHAEEVIKETPKRKWQVRIPTELELRATQTLTLNVFTIFALVLVADIC